MTLGQRQIAQYREQGWIAPIEVMSAAAAAGIAATLERAEAEHPTHLHATNRNNAHLAFPFLAELATHPTIVGCVQQLVGDDVSLWSTVLFIKEPDSAAFVSWHQDAHYMALEPDNFVTAWLALTPSTVENGCVSVLPGTHTTRSTHTDTFADNNILTRGQQVLGVDETTAVHLELEPGQMSLHHPWLIHGSQPNRSATRRVGIAMQSYLGANVRPTKGEHHVVPIAGSAPDRRFTVAPLPVASCTPEAIAARQAANTAFADVLYDGADKRRQL